MKELLAFVLFAASSAALAHPGHGLPGWIHPHAADYVLLAIAVTWAVAGAVLAAKKLRARK